MTIEYLVCFIEQSNIRLNIQGKKRYNNELFTAFCIKTVSLPHENLDGLFGKHLSLSDG